MVKGDKCSYNSCSKQAIGYQSNFQMGINVCEDCCHRAMLKMKSGESKTVGIWSLRRY